MFKEIDDISEHRLSITWHQKKDGSNQDIVFVNTLNYNIWL